MSFSPLCCWCSCFSGNRVLIFRNSCSLSRWPLSNIRFCWFTGYSCSSEVEAELDTMLLLAEANRDTHNGYCERDGKKRTHVALKQGCAPYSPKSSFPAKLTFFPPSSLPLFPSSAICPPCGVPGHEVFAVLTHIDAYEPDSDDDDDDEDDDEEDGAAAAEKEQAFLENSASSNGNGSGNGHGNVGEESSSGGGGKNGSAGGKSLEGGEFDRETELPGIISLW